MGGRGGGGSFAALCPSHPHTTPGRRRLWMTAQSQRVRARRLSHFSRSELAASALGGFPCVTFLCTHNMAWWIWVLIGFALLALEFVTTTMHIGLFALG